MKKSIPIPLPLGKKTYTYPSNVFHFLYSSPHSLGKGGFGDSNNKKE